MADSSWLISRICHNLMAHWFKTRFTTPKSPVLVDVFTRRLGDSLMTLSIRKAMLVATRFSIYFGNNAISSITS